MLELGSLSIHISRGAAHSWISNCPNSGSGERQGSPVSAKARGSISREGENERRTDSGGGTPVFFFRSWDLRPWSRLWRRKI